MATLEHVLADDLERHIGDWTRSIAAGIGAELPGLFADPASTDLALRGIDALLREFVSVLRSGHATAVRAPHAAVVFAEHLADRGTPLADVLRSYRIGQEASFMRAGQLAGESDEPDVGDAIARIGMLTFRYTDRVMTDVSAAFQERRDRRINRAVARREAVVARLLAGDPVANASTVLAYRVDGTHVAMVGVDGTDPASAVSALGIRGALVTSGAAWTRATTVDWRRLDGSGLRIAVGGPGGFTETYRRAQRAAALAAGTRDAVTHYRDVALRALLLTDDEAAQRFAADELGPLSDERGLRQTLLAYLDAGQDQTAAAARLGVHRNTVSRRIARAQELLGHPLGERRRELEAALLIKH